MAELRKYASHLREAGRSRIPPFLMTPIHIVKTAFALLRKTAVQWAAAEPFRNSTVIAYYTIFSLPGLLVIIVNLAGYFWGEEAIASRIADQAQQMIGSDSARAIETIMRNTNEKDQFTLSSILGFCTLIFGATGVFFHMQKSINDVWDVEPQPKKQFLKFLHDRLFSFGLIITVGFLLLVSLVLSAVLGSLSEWVGQRFSESLANLLAALDVLVSFSMITILFAAIFKVLPDAEVQWRDVWVGAVVTSLMFVIAKFALGFYFGHSEPGVAYGAASSVVLILLWVSYTTMVVLFGAQFTRVYAEHRGRWVRPSEIAVSAESDQKEGDNPQG